MTQPALGDMPLLTQPLACRAEVQRDSQGLPD